MYSSPVFCSQTCYSPCRQPLSISLRTVSTVVTLRAPPCWVSYRALSTWGNQLRLQPVSKHERRIYPSRCAKFLLCLDPLGLGLTVCSGLLKRASVKCLVSSIPTAFARWFARWYFEWTDAHPNDLPLLKLTPHFGPVPIKFCTVSYSSRQQSDLRRIIERAWETVPRPGRQLIVFCWCGLYSVRELRPSPTRVWTNLLPSSFSGRTFVYLRKIACSSL